MAIAYNVGDHELPENFLDKIKKDDKFEWVVYMYWPTPNPHIISFSMRPSPGKSRDDFLYIYDFEKVSWPDPYYEWDNIGNHSPFPIKKLDKEINECLASGIGPKRIYLKLRELLGGNTNP